MAKPLRVCPTFKLYWVKNSEVVKIKRYDHNVPFITPPDILLVVEEVFPNFDRKEHLLKYQDRNELVDLSSSDKLSFQFNEKFTLVCFYVFPSAQDAEHFVPLQSVSPRLQYGEMVPGRLRRNATTAGHVSIDLSEDSNAPDLNPLDHPMVTCDNCGSISIRTARFKCLECVNYDLCSACERKNIHAEHLMIRVPLCFVEAQGLLYNSVVSGIVAAAEKNIPHTID